MQLLPGVDGLPGCCAGCQHSQTVREHTHVEALHRKATSEEVNRLDAAEAGASISACSHIMAAHSWR